MIYPLQTFEKKIKFILEQFSSDHTDRFVRYSMFEKININGIIQGEKCMERTEKLNHAGRQMEAIKGDESHGRFSI